MKVRWSWWWLVRLWCYRMWYCLVLCLHFGGTCCLHFHAMNCKMSHSRMFVASHTYKLYFHVSICIEFEIWGFCGSLVVSVMISLSLTGGNQQFIRNCCQVFREGHVNPEYIDSMFFEKTGNQLPYYMLS